jgi:hypothetical protein
VDYRDVVPFIFWPWLAFSCYVLIKRSRAKRQVRHDEVRAADVQLPPAGSGAVIGPSRSAPDAGPSRSAPHGLPPSVTVPAGQSIFDAPSIPEPTASRRPIAEMVEGIVLPCDLTPLVSAERPIGARQSVAFVTRGFVSHEVGRRVGEELRRLGYELTPRHATEVVATRGDDWLAVAVHDNSGTIERGGRPAFPGAGDAAVVVELWTE